MDVVRRAFALVPEYLQTPRGGAWRRQSDGYRHPARPPVPGTEALDDAAVVRRRRAYGRCWTATWRWPGSLPAGSMLIRTSNAGASPIQRRLLPGMSAPECPATISMSSTSGCSRQSTAPARSSCPTRASTPSCVLRLAIGHLRTTESHVARAWELLQGHMAALVVLLSH